MSAVCFGEILWDVLPNEKLAGGAPMNVCYHLNKLAERTIFISKIGDDENGRLLLNFLKQNNIESDLVQIDSSYPTSTVIATQKGNEMDYDIVAPVAWDFIDTSTPITDAVVQAQYFVCGSLAARNHHSRNSLFTLLNLAKKIVVDINLRPPHFEKNTLERLLSKADILKLNNHELALIANWYTDELNFEQQVKLISEKFTISLIIITNGANGAAILVDNTFYTHPGYKVKVVDTIGSGDAFLAGFLSKYINGASPATALDFACKLGAFVASQKGGCPHYSIADIENQIV